MAKFRYCKHCGQRFEYTRHDHYFHTPACAAAYYRANPNPDFIHAENFEEIWFECEYCHVEFSVNGYANRGGQRKPKYCSNKHKQAAYRARGQEPQPQAERRQKATAGTGSKQQGSAAPNSDGAPSWQHVGSSRYSAEAFGEAMSILGCKRPFTESELKKCHRAKIGFWHPDRNTSPHATAWAQAVNWSYEFIRTHTNH